jgi:hypothetical protein
MSTGAKVAIGVVGGLVALVVLAVVAIALLGEEAEPSFERTGEVTDGGDGDRGDGGDGGGDAAATVPEGYHLVEGDGVSIAVPESWDEIAPEDFAMTDEEFRQAFPNAPQDMLQQGGQFFEQGAVLVAFDTTSEFASNVNVIDIPGEAPLGLVEGQAESELSTLGAELHETGRVDLPIGEALRVEFTLDVATPGGGSVAARGVQFYAPVDGRTYIITISTTDEGELADRMIDTFRAG